MTTLGTVPTNAVLLRLDGVVHTSDLPVQSFARHLTEHLPAELVHPLIAGMRGFLENKAELVPAGTDFCGAEDGYQAVEQLALASGLTPTQIAAARRSSRVDLANSCWAVDASDGLDELLAGLPADCACAVYAEPADPAAPAVLEALDLAARVELLPESLPAAAARMLGGATPDGNERPGGILVIGTRWAGELETAAAAGCATAMVDRYQLGRGLPDCRAADLLGLIAHSQTWAATGSTVATWGKRQR
jgi:hypothetical protein